MKLKNDIFTLEETCGNISEEHDTFVNGLVLLKYCANNGRGIIFCLLNGHVNFAIRLHLIGKFESQVIKMEYRSNKSKL